MSSTNSVEVLSTIRTLIEQTIPDFHGIYSAADTEPGKRLPLSLNALPAVLILPGPTREFKLSAQSLHHAWDVRVLVMCAAMDNGLAAADTLPFSDQIIDTFVANVKLNGIPRVTLCRFDRRSGFAGMQWADTMYFGEEITLLVIEDATVSPAP